MDLNTVILTARIAVYRAIQRNLFALPKKYDAVATPEVTLAFPSGVLRSPALVGLTSSIRVGRTAGMGVKLPAVDPRSKVRFLGLATPEAT